MFVAGMLVGTNYPRNSKPPQIDIAIVQDEQPQTQAQNQTQVLHQPDAVGNNVIAPPIISDTKVLAAVVRPKDTLEKILKRNGINAKDAKAIIALKQAAVLNKMRVGDKLNLTVEKTKTNEKTITKLRQLVYIIDKLNTLTVVSHGKSWRAKIKHVDPKVKLSYVAASIHGTVYGAASKQGISRKMIAQLRNIFSNKVDVTKLHDGDRVALVYKEYTVNGESIKDKEIVAGEVLHKNQAYRMIGFTDKSGHTDFYTPDGYNSKPPFQRIPVNYSRIGSRFSANRFHPILGFSRPHLGVDFSAPFGTPIKATSSGVVEFAGNKGGHGRAVKIGHGKYSALYAHLSRFSKEIFAGRHVKQGQIIGYVGTSGLATGPHLHYEFHINGVPHDPLKVKLPTGEMIAPEHRKNFFALSSRMLAQFDLHKNDNRMIAMSDGVVVESESKKHRI